MEETNVEKKFARKERQNEENIDVVATTSLLIFLPGFLTERRTGWWKFLARWSNRNLFMLTEMESMINILVRTNCDFKYRKSASPSFAGNQVNYGAWQWYMKFVISLRWAGVSDVNPWRHSLSGKSHRRHMEMLQEYLIASEDIWSVRIHSFPITQLRVK